MMTSFSDRLRRRQAHVSDILSQYIDGEVTPAERARIEAHLATCEACRRELIQLRRVVSLLHSVPMAPAPRSFALTPRMAPAPRRWWRLSEYAPVAAAVAASLFLVVLFADLRLRPVALPSLQAPRAVMAPAAPAADQIFSEGSAAPPTQAPAATTAAGAFYAPAEPTGEAQPEEAEAASLPAPENRLEATPQESPSALAAPAEPEKASEAQSQADAATEAPMAALGAEPESTPSATDSLPPPPAGERASSAHTLSPTEQGPMSSEAASASEGSGGPAAPIAPSATPTAPVSETATPPAPALSATIAPAATYSAPIGTSETAASAPPPRMGFALLEGLLLLVFLASVGFWAYGRVAGP